MQREGGLKDSDFTVKFKQSFAASETYATLYSLIGVSTAITFLIDNDSAISATNPEFQWDAILEGFPIGGAAGDRMVTTCKFMGNGDITVDTTP